MPVLAVIEIAFDPQLRLGDVAFRWQTVGLTLALLTGIALVALRAGYVPPPPARARPAPVTRRPLQRRLVGDQYPRAPEVVQPAEEAAQRRLRLDDLLFIVVGIVPGAVIGGRLVHGLVFWDAYAVQPDLLLDAGVGALSLTGAVIGGTLSGGYACRLLGAPVRRWADAAAVPMLVTLGLGKAAQILGGSGQGAFFDGAWAVAFIGPGPWVSANPQTPAHPSQLYEAAWLLAGAAVVGVAGPLYARRAGRAPAPGAALALAVAWFLAGRVVVGVTWRDPVLLGPLNAEQLIALALLAAAGGAIAWRFLWPRYREGVNESEWRLVREERER